MYETVWVRQLSYILGNANIATTLVLTAFMAGLSLGAGLLGSRADRLERPLRVYGWLEIAIAAAAMVVPAMLEVIQRLHTKVVAGSLPEWAPHVIDFVLVSALLVVPTALMGSTLPILVRWTAQQGDLAGRSLGWLYGLNNLGAVAGGLFAGYHGLRHLGLEGTTHMAMAINALVGLVALALDLAVTPARAAGGEPADTTRADPPERVPSSQVRGSLPFAAICGVIFVAGFAAMLFEIALMKVLPLILGSSTYSFSVIVCAFITGIAAGSFAAGLALPRVQRPEILLGACMIAAGLCFLLTIPLCNKLPVLYLWLKSQMSGSFETMQVIGAGLCFLIMLVPTFVMGGTLPLAVHLGTQGDSRVARQVGVLYTANTAGNILGTMITGLVLVPRLGFKATMEAGVAMQLVTGLTLITLAGKPPRGPGRAVVGILVVIGLYAHLYPEVDVLGLTAGVFRMNRPGSRSIEAALHENREIVFQEEDDQAFVTVERDAGTGILTLRVNGKPDASTGKDMPTQKLLAHLPLLVHGSAQQVLIIGLGSGSTPAAALRHPIRSLEVVELSPAVIRARQHFVAATGEIEKDSRLRVVNADGRNFLTYSSRSYDVVISEPSNPWCAGIATLYTREFFGIVRDHLTPDGVMCQWVQAYEMDPATFNLIVRTFRQVFPHVELFCVSGGDVLMLGSGKPIGLPGEILERRIAAPGVKEDMTAISVSSAMTLLGHHLLSSPRVEEFAGPGEINTDDLPILEYLAPYALYSRVTPTFPSSMDRVYDPHSPLRAYLSSHVPTTVEVFEFCQVLSVQYQPEVMMSLVSEAIERDLSNVPLRLARARNNLAAKRAREALEDLDELVSMGQRGAYLSQLRYEAALELESKPLSFSRPRRFPIALAAARELVDFAPDDPAAHARVASILFETRRWEEAEQEYRKAIELGSAGGKSHPDKPIHLLQLEKCRREMARMIAPAPRR